MNPDPDEHRHPGTETMLWGSGIKEKNREKKPESIYSAFGEHARKFIPGESQCKMFCGGKHCKYCTSSHWTPEQMVVSGLFSEWVTDNILAMARMNNAAMEEHKMIDQLKSLEIKAVICLQQAGEHAFCGHGNDESGFSYNPQKLMESGIFFYNFPLPDYGVSSMASILDIVKVMQFAMSSGKVAVHCHAGLGRTGLIIACYLIYNNRVNAAKCVQYVRSRRAGSIQTKQQMKTCHEFEQFLKMFYIIFPSKIDGAHEFSFQHFLHRQRHLLHGYEARKLKHIPKVIYVCCERLLELCGKGHALSLIRNLEKDPVPEGLILSTPRSELSGGLETDSVGTSSLNASGKDARSISPAFMAEAGKDARFSEKSGVLSSSQSKQSHGIQDSQDSMNMHIHSYKAVGDEIALNGRDVVNDSDEDYEDDDDDSSIVYGQNVGMALGGNASICSQMADTMSVDVKLDVDEVCFAIVESEVSTSQQENIDRIECKLNEADEAWKILAREEDPIVICNIMWDWLDQLKEPVLRVQDLNTLKEFSHLPDTALHRLEKSTKHFLEYLALVLSNLSLASHFKRVAVMKRFLSHLTQSSLDTASSAHVGRSLYGDEDRMDGTSQILDLITRLVEHQRSKIS